MKPFLSIAFSVFALSTLPVLLYAEPAAPAAEPTQQTAPTTEKTAPAVETVLAKAPDIEELLKQAQAHYDQRATPGEAEKSLALYASVLKQDKDHYEALWKSARSFFWVGDHAPQGKQIDYLDQGKAMALRAQEANKDGLEGYYWFGVCEGRASEIRGVLNSLFAINPIRKSMEKVLTIDPNYGPAHHILGVLYRKAPGWPLSCGDINKSLEYARKAVECSPDEVLPRIGLAKTLIAKGQKDEARTILEEAQNLPGPAHLQPETAEQKKKAQATLAKLH